MARVYDNTQRALRAADTTQAIVSATEALVLSRPLSEVTLPAIGAGAGVTVQTVLRHMGSREGCIEALAERVRARVEAQRSTTVPGDVEAALAELLHHYELEGRLVLRLLAEEGRDALASRAVDEGRAFHRAWVVRCFGPRLRDVQASTVDALVGATDLYLWKLFRLDLGRSEGETKLLITRLVRGVLESP